MSNAPEKVRIFIARGGAVHGPYALGKIFAFVKDGKLNDSDLAWHAGMGNEWEKLGNLLAGLEEGEKKVNQVQELVDKILKLVEREEFELATDLIFGMCEPILFEELFDGACLEGGELGTPEWVGWEEKNKTFFLQLLARAPATEKIESLRQGVEIIEHTFYEVSDEHFPVELFDFPNLRTLRLRGGDFKSIPQEISRLNGLEELSLEDMNIQKLPDALEELGKLKTLGLQSNEFSKEDANLEVLARLKSLVELDLSYSRLTSFSVDSLKNISDLKVLSLEGNDLHGNEDCLSVLAKISGLRDLSLKRCNLARLSEIKEGWNDLQKMDLSENEIESLPSFLSRLNNLKWINLAQNPVYWESSEDEVGELGNQGVENWVDEESEEEQTKDQESTFVFSRVNTQVDCRKEEFEKSFPDTIILSDESRAKLQEFERWMEELVFLDPDPNWIDEKIDELISFADEHLLIELVRGCTLEKSGVLITGSHFPFPYWVIELFPSTSLYHDSQSDWSETGWGGDVKSRHAAGFHYLLLRLIPRLPNHPAVDPSLRIERISSLDLCLPGCLPREIGEYCNLRELSITKNSLCEIPKEISLLSNLEILQIDDNQLQSLPASICRLKNLKYLGLSGNKIKEISPEIGGLKNLEVVDLSCNRIVHLPMQLGNLSELKFLGLKGNRLQNLPPEIWTLYKLKHLWIGSNPIESLPQEIYEMDDLEVLGICETGCSPENTAWVLGREVFLSSNTKSMMLVREKDEKLLERIKEELKVWN